MKQEKSCGCIIVKDNKVLLINQKNGNFWGFPKGHVEKFETEIETALRETKEETGLDVLITSPKRYLLNYNVSDKISKTVILYLAIPKNDQIIIQESEITNIKWCSFDEALELLTYDDLKNIFKEVLLEL